MLFYRRIMCPLCFRYDRSPPLYLVVIQYVQLSKMSKLKMILDNIYIYIHTYMCVVLILQCLERMRPEMRIHPHIL